MPRVGRSHFETYTDQNRAKHAILTNYLLLYLTALRKTADAFHFIDGFAGPGAYGGDTPGSPVRAIELLAQQPLPSSASFVESDAELFTSLRGALASVSATAKLFDEPFVERGEFSEWIDAIFERPIYKRFRKVATFAFVDPCGVKGLRMQDLARILSMPFGECLVFWNYDGLNRWFGGIAAGTHDRTAVDALYGSSEAASDAIAAARDASTPSARELVLRQSYLRAIRERSGARFVLPFRFQSNDRERTSHYLFHLSRHERAFTIMKEVMSRQSSVEDVGSFEFIPKGEAVAQGSLFHPNADRARADVLDALGGGAKPATMFTREWPARPDDFMVGDQYKNIILELERDGAVEIQDRKTRRPKPAESRLRAGKVTLGDSCLVRLKHG